MSLINQFIKKLKVVVLVTMSISFSMAQSTMEDVKWHELDPPNLGVDNYEAKNVAVDILDNGKIYLAYVNYPDQLFSIHKYNVLLNEWEEVASHQINTSSGGETNGMISYAYGNTVFYGLNRQGSPSGYLTLFEMDADENLVVHMENEVNNLYQIFDFDMTYDATNEIVYFSGLDDNFASVIYSYEIVNTAFNQVSSIQNTNAVPVIGIDATTNTLYQAVTDNSDEILIYSGTLVGNPANLNLTAQGNLNSSLLAVAPRTYKMHMIDKDNGAPDLIFFIDFESPDDGTYRVNLAAENTDLMVSSYGSLFVPPFSTSLAVTGRGDNTYLYGAHDWQDAASGLELFPNGTESIVANDHVPYTLNNDGAELVQIGSSPLFDRLVGYYRQYGPAPEIPGRFTITNRPPDVQSISEVGQGCFSMSSTAVFIDEILFNDPDGDVVEIIAGSVQTSGNGMVDAMKNSNGDWQLYGNFEQPGSVQISFTFTDGLDTMNHQFNYDPGVTPAMDFLEESFTYCTNDLPLQSSDLLNEPATGQFTLNSNPTIDGDIIALNDLQNINYIYGDEVMMFYESTDEFGCTYNYNAYLMVFETPEISMAVQPSTCGNNDGSALATVSGANGSFTEYWSTGDQNTNTINDLAPGTYYYNIEDDQTCKAVAQANIAATGLSIDGSISPLSCHNANDASIDLDLTGFTDPTILWSTGHGSLSLTDLSSGTYEVSVWDDPDCIVTESFTIVNPPKFTVDFDVILPSSCSANDGEIMVLNENNASGTVTYEWSDGTNNNNLSGISNGIYNVEVSDGTCNFNETFIVNSSVGPSANATIVNTECDAANGEILLNVNASAGEEISGFNWSNNSSSQNINGLAPGIYSVEITQTDGCVSVYEYEVKTKRPVTPEICIVSVDTTTNTNLIVWEKPENDFIDYYNIYRETSVAGEFKIVGTVDYDDISVFNDVVASPSVRSWRYRISAVNHCETESHLSTIHKTIHLVTQEDGVNVTVSWDNYEGFTYNSYSLLRYTDLLGWEVLEPSLALASLPFYDDIPPSLGGLDYMIEVAPPGGICTATFGKAQDYNSSRSNKPTSVFNPGEGTGDPSNSLASFENENFSVVVYPNPSNGSFKLELSHKLSTANLNMDIVDFNGKIIHAGQVQNGVNHIQLETVQAGMYFVKLYDTTNSETIRIVVQ